MHCIANMTDSPVEVARYAVFALGGLYVTSNSPPDGLVRLLTSYVRVTSQQDSRTAVVVVSAGVAFVVATGLAKISQGSCTARSRF